MSHTTTCATGSLAALPEHSARVLFDPEGETERHEGADSFPLRPREKRGGFKAINTRCSKDLQAVVDGYCKFWVKLPFL